MNQLKPCRDLQYYELKQRRQKEKDLAAAGLSNNPEERRKTRQVFASANEKPRINK